MEFDEIKNQIESNYNEIQTTTAKIVIQKLGLGNGIKMTADVKS